MRAIKFRGFNAKNNQWLYGSHIINRGKHFVAPDEFADDKTWEDYEVEPETIGQFTGLFDKNGKEIYEGDIIKWYEIGHSDHQFVGGTFCADREVVGNVHDNPDLIEKGGRYETAK